MTDYPPKSWQDVFMYEDAEIVAGYMEWSADDPAPGENRSPGYRWGWANNARDHSREDDGFDGIRHAAIIHWLRDRETAVN